MFSLILINWSTFLKCAHFLKQLFFWTDGKVGSKNIFFNENYDNVDFTIDNELSTIPVICLCIAVGQSAHQFMRLGPTPQKETCNKKVKTGKQF